MNTRNTGVFDRRSSTAFLNCRVRLSAPQHSSVTEHHIPRGKKSQDLRCADLLYFANLSPILNS
jgi:hypothetical protein